MTMIIYRHIYKVTFTKMIAFKYKPKVAYSGSQPQLNHSLAGNWPKPVFQFPSCTTVAFVALCSTDQVRRQVRRANFAEDLPLIRVGTVALFHQGF